MKTKFKKYWYIFFPILFASILIVLYLLKNNNPETTSIFPPCLLYKFTGIKCAGCGMTRAMHYILNLDFKKALSFSIFPIILIVYFIYVIIKCIIIKLKGKKIHINDFNASLYVLTGVTIMYMIIRNFINI